MQRNPLEKEIEEKIGKYAKSKGCRYKKFVSPANRGEPDRLIVNPHGACGFLEVKRRKKKPTPLQCKKLDDLKAQQCVVGWCDNVEDGKKFVDELLLYRLVKTEPDFC